MPTNCRPCVDPEMRNALAIERNTAAITAITNSLHKITSDYEEIAKKIAELDESIRKYVLEKFEEIFQGRLDQEKEERIAGDENLKNLIDALQEYVDKNMCKMSDIEAERIARQDADLILEAKIKAHEHLAARLVAKEAELRGKADCALSVRIKNLEDKVPEAETRFDQEVEERKAADKALGERIDTEAAERKAADEVLTNRIEEVHGELETAKVELNQRIDATTENLETAKTELNARIDTETSERSAADEALSGRATALEGRATELETKQAELEGRQSSLEERQTAVEGKTDTFDAKVEGLKARIENAEVREHGHFTALSERIDELEKLVREIIVR